MLLDSYIADMTKYASSGESVKIFAAYDSLPSQLARDTKKFQYKLIKSGARASQYGDSIDWLIRAGIVNKCVKCTQGFMPPSAFLELSAFKLYYSDTGILSARTGMNLERLMGNEAERLSRCPYMLCFAYKGNWGQVILNLGRGIFKNAPSPTYMPHTSRCRPGFV